MCVRMRQMAGPATDSVAADRSTWNRRGLLGAMLVGLDTETGGDAGADSGGAVTDGEPEASDGMGTMVGSDASRIGSLPSKAEAGGTSLTGVAGWREKPVSTGVSPLLGST